MGVEADLELAAERGKHPPQSTCTHLRCYTHPLVRVKLSNSKILHLEPQIEGLATGALSPEVEGEQALILSRLDPNVQTVSVPVSTNQRSTATANLRLDESGSIFGTINIQFAVSWCATFAREAGGASTAAHWQLGAYGILNETAMDRAWRRVLRTRSRCRRRSSGREYPSPHRLLFARQNRSRWRAG